MPVLKESTKTDWTGLAIYKINTITSYNIKEMYIMAINSNELILDRVRYLTAHDLETKEKLFMLTQLEDPSLNCTAEGEDVTDAVGALITTMYRSKQAEFTATNSLLSLDLAAAQYGSKKEVAGEDSKIVDWTYEFIDIPAGTEEVTLAKKPVEDSVKFIYAVENGAASTSYAAAAAASATEFVIGDDGKITLPTGLADKVNKIFVEYKYETTSAVKIVNGASDFPEACEVVIYAIFRDVCNENKVYAGKIICPKAKLDPSSIELALTSTGKHAFTLKMFKDYCSTNEELFTIVVSE